jgi:glycosyltransferase involved in cell wall biosynthesis
MVSRAPVGSYTSKLVKGFSNARPEDHLKVLGRQGETRNQQYITMVETWTSTLFPFQIFRRVCRDKPEVVHVQHEFGMFGKPATMTIMPLLYFFLRFLRVKTVSTIHSTIFPDALSDGSIEELLPIAAWIPRIVVEVGLHLVYGPACRLSNLVIVHQRSQKTKLQRFYRIKANKIAFIPHGVGRTEYPATQDSLSRWKATIGNRRVALYFGYVSPRKGLDYLLDAFEKFSSLNPEWMLILAGGLSKEYYRPYFDHIRASISDKNLKDRVLMTGFVPETEADALFLLCDLVVLPYTHVVGNASACNLAMGYGKPIVATNISPFPEEITDGRDGILCSPQNSGEILGAMEKLSSDTTLYNEMCKNVQAISASRDWEAIARWTHSLYESILSDNGQPVA